MESATNALSVSSHILVAMVKEKPLGYLRFVVQLLGEHEERPLKFQGDVLRKAEMTRDIS
jgi:hypothetical protein